MTSANCLNLSFLRLVGISQPGGVTFHIGGIFGEDVLDTLERAIGLATKEVYSQFMKPIKLTIALEVSEPSVERERTIEVQAPEVVDGTAPASGVAA